MQFRLARIATVAVLLAASGCASASEPSADVATLSGDHSRTSSSSAAGVAPFVGTWRWSGSGTTLGTIPLGEEHMVFRADGTYTVVSKSGDGIDECYEGTFAWRPSAGGERSGIVVFNATYERDTYLDDHDTLHFSAAGNYVKSTDAVPQRCR